MGIFQKYHWANKTLTCSMLLYLKPPHIDGTAQIRLAEEPIERRMLHADCEIKNRNKADSGRETTSAECFKRHSLRKLPQADYRHSRLDSEQQKLSAARRI